jgi:hypothetical protein
MELAARNLKFEIDRVAWKQELTISRADMETGAFLDPLIPQLAHRT